MKIGLQDVDSKNGNLALMKISSYHKKKGDSVEMATLGGEYDILYKSKIFTWTNDEEVLCSSGKTIKGGTGYNIYDSLPDDIEHQYPDYWLFNIKESRGFITRGCIRKCDFCVVPKKEGAIRPNAHLGEFLNANFEKIILYDNNILAHEHGIKELEKIADTTNYKFKLDCNQGLDARLVDDSIAKILSKIRWSPCVRLSCDSINELSGIEKTVKRLRNNNVKPSNYFIYVLVKDVLEAEEIVVRLRDLKCDPFAQPYRDQKNTKPSKEQKMFARWVNHKAIFKTVKNFRDYK
jgi:hypothetical protein